MPIRPINRDDHSVQPQQRSRPRSLREAEASSDEITDPPFTPDAKQVEPRMGRQKGSGNWDENGNYKVGKNRPPAEHRFKPGMSGNPRGPKRGSKSVSVLGKKIFGRKVPVKGRTGTKSLDALGIALTKIYESAAKGERWAIEQVLAFYREQFPDQPVDDDLQLSPGEADAIARILNRAGLDDTPVRRDTRRDSPDDDRGSE